jgi:alkylated DNA nucleotide flippase Atl1
VPEPDLLRAIPLPTKERLYDFVARIPSGHVVTYLQIVRTLGFPSSSYARVIPGLLAPAAHLPVHRVVASDLRLVERHVPDQKALLAGEGVHTEAGAVSVAALWDSSFYFAESHGASSS